MGKKYMELFWQKQKISTAVQTVLTYSNLAVACTCETERMNCIRKSRNRLEAMSKNWKANDIKNSLPAFVLLKRQREMTNSALGEKNCEIIAVREYWVNKKTVFIRAKGIYLFVVRKFSKT